eukprot:m.476924 g.476924  ORF g.476924 m.476924 type:complete len:137 (+) comp20702_c0_seq1:1142-1552(+)
MSTTFYKVVLADSCLLGAVGIGYLFAPEAMLKLYFPDSPPTGRELARTSLATSAAGVGAIWVASLACYVAHTSVGHNHHARYALASGHVIGLANLLRLKFLSENTSGVDTGKMSVWIAIHAVFASYYLVCPDAWHE